MRTGEIRSIRLNSLLSMAVRKDVLPSQVYAKALSLGVSVRTAKGYVSSVYAMIEQQRRKKSK